jgi:plastocyanin
MIHTRVLVAAAAIALLLAGCGSSDKKAATTTSGAGAKTTATPATDKGATGNAVAIKGFAFGPSSLKVPAGTKVTWTNNDPADHTTTADKGDPASFDSGHLAKGKTFSYTFAKKGTYKYHCDIHTYMTGTVDVS